MNAIVVRAHGGPEVLRAEEVADPLPAAGEVAVGVAASGVNFVDIYERSGAYDVPVPFTPGREAAGIVESVGEGVTEFAPGDRVAYATHRGAYAERTVVPASALLPIPEGVSLETAAAVLLQGLTAHYLSHSTYPLGSGDVALVHAAAGGVGLLLVQMAKLRGASVVGTVSTEEKEALARAAGADHVIRYTESDFVSETLAVTDGKGVSVVYDSVGQATFDGSLACLRRRGTLALYGQASGPVGPIDPQILNKGGSLFLTRPTLKDYVATREELLARSGDLFRWIAAGDLHVRVDRSFALAEAPEAHAYMEARKTRGKILLVP